MMKGSYSGGDGGFVVVEFGLGGILWQGDEDLLLGLGLLEGGGAEGEDSECKEEVEEVHFGWWSGEVCCVEEEGK